MSKWIEDPNDPHYILPALRREVGETPKPRSEFVMRTPSTKPVNAPEAETAADSKPARRASPKPAKPAAKASAKGNGKAKATAKAKPAAKAAKAKPRQADPAKLDNFGLRKGSIKSRAAALYARKSGATLAEVKAECDSVQFNVLTELKDKGFKVDTKQEDGNGNRKISRYFLKAK